MCEFTTSNKPTGTIKSYSSFITEKRENTELYDIKLPKDKVELQSSFVSNKQKNTGLCDIKLPKSRFHNINKHTDTQTLNQSVALLLIKGDNTGLYDKTLFLARFHNTLGQS